MEEEAQQSLLHTPCGEDVEGEIDGKDVEVSLESCSANWVWWIQVALYIFFVLAGQAGGTILGRVYYERGGKSNWLVTLTQSVGFPILIPFLFVSPAKHSREFDYDDDGIRLNRKQSKVVVFFVLVSVYALLGALLSLCSVLYSGGIENLPASTYSLLSSTQLAFNAIFSFLLNGQRFTPYITNSVVILTFSSVLFVFKPDSDSNSSGGDFLLGVMLTVASSAGCALMFSVTQLAFQRIIREENMKETVKLAIWQPFFATVVNVFGLFASGEWAGLGRERAEYGGGAVAYWMVLVWTAVSWEAYNVGTIGLTSKVSSLFSNVVIMLSRVIVPFLSMVFLHEEFGGIEVLALLMALWGFASYIYQQYLDDLKMGKVQDPCSKLWPPKH